MLLPTNVLAEIIPSNVTVDSGSKVLPKTVQTNQRRKWSQECFNKRQKSCVCWRGGGPPDPSYKPPPRPRRSLSQALSVAQTPSQNRSYRWGLDARYPTTCIPYTISAKTFQRSWRQL